MYSTGGGAHGYSHTSANGSMHSRLQVLQVSLQRGLKIVQKKALLGATSKCTMGEKITRSHVMLAITILCMCRLSERVKKEAMTRYCICVGVDTCIACNNPKRIKFEITGYNNKIIDYLIESSTIYLIVITSYFKFYSFWKFLLHSMCPCVRVCMRVCVCVRVCICTYAYEVVDTVRVG